MRGLIVALALALVACGHDHEDGMHEHGDQNHNHAPKYGGRLVELGEHEFQVELLHYPEDGRLEAYLWDGHVEVPVPTTQKGMQIKVSVGDMMIVVELAPATNPYAKEAEGKTAKFEGQHDKLKGLGEFEGELIEVSLADKTFKSIAFVYGAEPHDHDHDH